MRHPVNRIHQHKMLTSTNNLRSYAIVSARRSTPILDQLDGHASPDLYRLVMQEVEEPLFEAVLARTQGNHSKAAATLGMNRGTLRKKLKHYGIE